MDVSDTFKKVVAMVLKPYSSKLRLYYKPKFLIICNYNRPCVQITEEPPEDESWFCPKHEPGAARTPPKKGAVVAAPAKRGRGRGRGKKKKM